MNRESSVIPFRKTRFKDEESVVRPALKVTGLAAMTALCESGTTEYGKPDIAHPERMLVLSLSVKPTPDEIERIWAFVERLRIIR